MPFNDQEIADAGLAVLDHYVKNKPVDQIAVDRILLSALQAAKKTVPAAKQYIVEQLRYTYNSNFMWFNGAQQVTYNRKQTLAQAQYPWRSAHDGFGLDEDRLVQHGIAVDDNGPGGQASRAEFEILTNIMMEQTESLRLGWEERFSKHAHLNGAQSSEAIAGLDFLVSTTPTTGTVGGINRATAGNAYWRNHASLNLDNTTTTGNILDQMELVWRNCRRNGGRPNKIIVGSTYLDEFRAHMLKSYGRMDFGQVGFSRVQTGTDMITFHGVEMDWAPEFSELDSEFGGSPTWEKRCYFLSIGDNIRLRPMKGQDMKNRKPPRPYDRYEHYFALTWRGALTMNRGNQNGVMGVD